MCKQTERVRGIVRDARDGTTQSWEMCQAACVTYTPKPYTNIDANRCSIYAWSANSGGCYFRPDGVWGGEGTHTRSCGPLLMSDCLLNALTGALQLSRRLAAATIRVEPVPKLCTANLHSAMFFAKVNCGLRLLMTSIFIGFLSEVSLSWLPLSLA